MSHFVIVNEDGLFLGSTKKELWVGKDKKFKTWGSEKKAEKVFAKLELKDNCQIIESNEDGSVKPKAKKVKKKDESDEDTSTDDGAEEEGEEEDEKVFGKVDPEILFKGELNEKCIKCSKSCKQSAVATIDHCPAFKKA